MCLRLLNHLHFPKQFIGFIAAPQQHLASISGLTRRCSRTMIASKALWENGGFSRQKRFGRESGTG
jgi:hypothetical protein